MIRKIFFWLHLSVGATTGIFIFIMAATGVLLSFERQVVDFADKDVRSIAVPNDAQPMRMASLIEAVQRANAGEPTAIVIRNEPQASVQVAMGRNKALYLDPYSGAILGASSARVHGFFSNVERIHRTLGSPLGSKGAGHWLIGVSNLLFSVVILLGLIIWLPRQWSWKALRASAAFRTGLRGRAREWNWHNVVGVWCALPLLIIALTGVVMSFEWANTLLFQLSGSTPPSFNRNAGERHGRGRQPATLQELKYEQLFAAAKALNHDWRTITVNVVRDPNGPVPATIDAGNGGQPQKRTQYLLDRDTGAVRKTITFASGSFGQKLRSFVRFGHTGEYGGWAGQLIAALASLGACLLVYTGLALSLRRMAAWLKRRKAASLPKVYAGQSTV